MPLRSGAFSMVREDNPITGNTAFRTRTRSRFEFGSPSLARGADRGGRSKGTRAA